MKNIRMVKGCISQIVINFEGDSPCYDELVFCINGTWIHVTANVIRARKFIYTLYKDKQFISAEIYDGDFQCNILERIILKCNGMND